MFSVYGHYKYSTLSVLGSTLDVRFWRLKSVPALEVLCLISHWRPLVQTWLCSQLMFSTFILNLKCGTRCWYYQDYNLPGDFVDRIWYCWLHDSDSRTVTCPDLAVKTTLLPLQIPYSPGKAGQRVNKASSQSQRVLSATTMSDTQDPLRPRGR